MKNLILSVTLAVACSTAFAQTKKTDSTKKIAVSNDVANIKPQLVQEKIWPLYDPKNKSRDTVILKPRPLGRTRIRL
jgi:hypothetical protein